MTGDAQRPEEEDSNGVYRDFMPSGNDELGDTFLDGVGGKTTIKKLDLLVSSAPKNVDSSGQSVEAAEKMGPDLKKEFEAAMSAYKEYEQAADECNKLQKEWETLQDAIDKNFDAFRKAVKRYESPVREYHEKAYGTGCTNLDKGLVKIELNVDEIAKQWGPIKKA